MSSDFNSCTVLIVGCGDLGTQVAKQLVMDRISVIGLRRRQACVEGGRFIQADVCRPDSLIALQEIKPQIILYCVAAETQSDIAYKLSYVDGLQNILRSQAHNHQLEHVFFISSTRVYGQTVDMMVDETLPAVPNDFGGHRLLEGERLLENLSCGYTVLRLSGIYGAGRSRMINLAQSPESWPLQNSWSNRIHRDDAASFIVFLIQKVLLGETLQQCYIVTDSSPAPQLEVLRWLAPQWKVDSPPSGVVSGGKRLSNRLMLSTGFKLKHPDYQSGYQALLKEIANLH